MSDEMLYLDVGSAVTAARSVKVSGDTFLVADSSACPTPPLSSEDLTAGLPAVLDALRERAAKRGPAFDPDRVAVSLGVGGEPRTVCAGVVKGISGESAKRAALLGGASVADLIAVDDGRQDFERVSDLRRQEASMVVLAGGVDEEIFQNGSHQLLNIAKVVAEGLPRRRGGGRVPLVYAASSEGREEVARIFGDSTEIIWVENVRSTLERENLVPAREAVAGSFASSAVRNPRLKGLGRLAASDLWPSGYVLSAAVEDYHRRTGENILVVSLDDGVQVVSAIGGVFTRTATPVERVSRERAVRHLPSQRLAELSDDILGNWKRRPFLLPRTWEEMALFLAFWKEAVREAMEDHKSTAVELRGIHRQRQISETFEVRVSGGDTLVRMERIPKVVFGGYLARLLSPACLVSIAADAAGLSGITHVLLDPCDAIKIAGFLTRSGVPAKFEDLLKPVGLVLSPGRGDERAALRRAFFASGEDLKPLPVTAGEMTVVPIQGASSDVEVILDPPGSKVDLGDGEGRRVRAKVVPGTPALYLDGRPRAPIRPDKAAQEVQKCYRNLGIFPEEVLSAFAGGKR